MEENNRRNEQVIRNYFKECFDKKPEIIQELFGTLNIKDIEIDVSHVDNAFIKYHDGDMPRCFFLDYETFNRSSNIMDVLFKNSCFLKSYQYGDKVRVFMGRLYYCPIMVRQFGCDVNIDDVILMPLDENGLLDEKQMIENIKKEKKDIGISIDKYKNAITDDFSHTLFKLNVYEFGIMTRMNKYEDYASRGKRR